MQWGGALSSARDDGQGFFDRGQAHAFIDWVSPAEKKYVIDLRARALLPMPGHAELGNDDGTLERTVYLQFKEHPRPAERDLIAKQGVQLLSYVSGYAWLARGKPEALQNALALDFVRAAAQIDPRDKLNRGVFAGQVPAYAQAENGDARLLLLAQPGTRLEAMQQALAAQPELSNLQAKAGPGSVLGPRFEVAAPIALARHLAALDQTTYVSWVQPPVASRDITSDTVSNIRAVRDTAQITGSGVKVALRELGKMDAHEDFSARLTYIDNDGSLSSMNVDHATAVTGVIGSSGVNKPAAKGVAPDVSMLAYAVGPSDTFATTDIVDAAGRGARVSNHSYGPAGLASTDFGSYEVDSADWDSAIRSNNLLVVAAGNEEVGGLYKHIDYFVGAKNTICVTSASSDARAGDPSASPPVSATNGIAFYSEHGPMDEGRIKPDLAAFGGNAPGADAPPPGMVMDLGTSSTQENSGTSFSTPVVTGVAALVVQEFKTVFGSEPNASMIKAILCNSAGDAGNPGPDATYGFGIVNAQEAIRQVDARKGSAYTPCLEDLVTNSATQTYLMDLSGIPQLRMTLCWMDVAGSPGAAKALVNDLDLQLVAPDGTKIYPFSLNANNPSALATRTGPNTVDPIEQIVIDGPMDGIWTVLVSGASIPNGDQPFSLCCNRSLLPANIVPAISASPSTGPAPLTVSFSGAAVAGGTTNYAWDFGDGTTDSGTDKGNVSHTYNSAGTYTVSLSTDGNTPITKIIQVTKPVAQATALKPRATLKFRGDPSAGDDSFQFTLFVASLARSSVQARADIPGFAGQNFTIRAGGTADGTTPPSTIQTVTLDARGQSRSVNGSFKLDLTHGTMQVQLKNLPLETIFASDGMTRSPSSSGLHSMPVEVESPTTIYRGVLDLFYLNRTGTSGTAR
jgi:PKD repeat protein